MLRMQRSGCDGWTVRDADRLIALIERDYHHRRLIGYYWRPVGLWTPLGGWSPDLGQALDHVEQTWMSCPPTLF